MKREPSFVLDTAPSSLGSKQPQSVQRDQHRELGKKNSSYRHFSTLSLHGQIEKAGDNGSAPAGPIKHHQRGAERVFCTVLFPQRQVAGLEGQDAVAGPGVELFVDGLAGDAEKLGDLRLGQLEADARAVPRSTVPGFGSHQPNAATAF